MVKIVDAIMGTGKSSAAITYMNEHSDKKFVYIAPYLDEAARIKQNCPELDFREPSKAMETGWSKLNHTAILLKNGNNIATTHQAFRMYTPEMIERIKSQHYTLIIDEAVSVFETLDIAPDDLQILIDAGSIKPTGDLTYRWVDTDYRGEMFRDISGIIVNHDLIRVPTGEGKRDILCYWELSPELVQSFDDVFVLTYMFKAQDLHHFMKMYNIEYEYIGISKENGVYRFSDKDFYVPAYVASIRDKIHITDNNKLNSIGDDKFAISASWFERNPDAIKKLKDNTYNFFNKIAKTDAGKRMWSTFKHAESKLKGKGYTNGFINFNEKATNEYKDRNVLVYDVNIFMHVGQKIFFLNQGIDVDDDMYALSIMVQWVWRSAIRDGNEIWLYVPSKRMRRIFNEWLDSLTEGGVPHGGT